MIRIAAILGNTYLSFPIPDYSAYSEMLSLFKNVCIGKERSNQPKGREVASAILQGRRLANGGLLNIVRCHPDPAFRDR